MTIQTYRLESVLDLMAEISAPVKWLFCISPQSKELYYYQVSTGLVTWNFPVDERCVTPLISTGMEDVPVVSTPGYAAKVNYQYESDDPSVLSLSIDDTVYVFSVKNNWAYCINVLGEKGFFPENNLEPIIPMGKPSPHPESIVNRYMSSRLRSSYKISPFSQDNPNVLLETPQDSSGRKSITGHHNNNDTDLRKSILEVQNTSDITEKMDNINNNNNSSSFTRLAAIDLSRTINQSQRMLGPSNNKGYNYTRDLVVDINDFEINDYATMYFTRKANNTPRSIHHFKSLNIPLTISPACSSADTALEIFKLIQSYMGDSKKWISTNEKSFETVENIKNLMIKSENLIDETYCQIMCQCIDNPSESSRRKGFELLVALSCVYTIYPPSRFLFGYIVKFLASNAVTAGVCGSLSYFSLKLLMGIEKPVDFTKELLIGLTEKALPQGVFNAKLDEIYNIEEKYQLICQNGVLINKVGSYGSHSGIGRSYLPLSPFIKPDNLYYILTKGAFMLLVRGEDHHLKEKQVCLSPLLDSLIVSSLSAWEGSRAIIPMRSFISVSRCSHGDEIINDLFIDSTFILNGLNSDDTMVFIASNKVERDRWLLAFRCYFDWYECSGKAIDANAIIANNNEELGKTEIKNNFVNHISSFLHDPNDFYTNLTTGIDITLKIDDNTQIGYFLLNPTLSLMFFYPEANQQHKISIDPEEITNISVTVGDPELSQISSGAPWAGSNIYIEFHDGRIWTINIESYYYHQLWAYMLYCYINWYNSITDMKLLTLSNDIIKSHFTAYISNPIIPPIEPKMMIPSFLKRIINRLNDLQAGTYEGIFRISPAKSQVDSHVKYINQGYYETMKLIENAHVGAGILKQWLRDMTEPIVPDCQLELMINSIKKNLKTLDFIQTLPKHNCDCLIYIMIYFKELLQWSDVTKMGRDAMAVVLSPNIIKNDRRVDNNVLEYAKSFIEKVIDEIELPSV